MKQRILITDEDPWLMDIARDCAHALGYQVQTTSDCWQALSSSITGEFSMLVLDGRHIGGPLLGEVQRCRTPVLVVTAANNGKCGDSSDVQHARAFVCEPVDAKAMLLAMKGLLSGARIEEPPPPEVRAETDSVIVDGSIELRCGTQRVLVRGRQLNVSESEYQLLRFLIVNPTEIFSRSDLSQQIWQGTSSEQAVASTVARLRKKLAVAEPARSPIATVRGKGYRYIPLS